MCRVSLRHAAPRYENRANADTKNESKTTN
jgi:hypothetical protein